MTSVQDVPHIARAGARAFAFGGIRAIEPPCASTPARALAHEYAPHAHQAGQLLFTTRGVLVLDVEGQRWITPPLLVF